MANIHRAGVYFRKDHEKTRYSWWQTTVFFTHRGTKHLDYSGNSFNLSNRGKVYDDGLNVYLVGMDEQQQVQWNRHQLACEFTVAGLLALKWFQQEMEAK